MPSNTINPAMINKSKPDTINTKTIVINIKILATIIDIAAPKPKPLTINHEPYKMSGIIKTIELIKPNTILGSKLISHTIMLNGAKMT